jgi:hypothetical protein
MLSLDFMDLPHSSFDDEVSIDNCGVLNDSSFLLPNVPNVRRKSVYASDAGLKHEYS